MVTFLPILSNVDFKDRYLMTQITTITVPFEKCRDCGRFSFTKDYVSLPIAEYEALQAKASAVNLGQLNNYRKMSRTRIARNPEHAEFVLNLLPTMTVTETLKLFQKRFGENMISRSQLYRFAHDTGFVNGR